MRSVVGLGRQFMVTGRKLGQRPIGSRASAEPDSRSSYIGLRKRPDLNGSWPFRPGIDRAWTWPDMPRLVREVRADMPDFATTMWSTHSASADVWITTNDDGC